MILRKTTLLGFSFFFASVIGSTAVGQSKQTLEQLRQQITAELAKQAGVFAVAFKNLSTGQALLIREQEVFHAASTMKTPVMIEVYKQAAQHRLALSDSVLVKNTFKSIVDGSPYSLKTEADSEPEIYHRIGTKQTLSSLVYDMIIASSNLATNLVIERVDARNVTQTMRDLGAPTIEVRRGVEDAKAFAAGLNNTTTAYDQLVIFQKLATGEAVSPEASKAMTAILLDQRFNNVIPAQLPKGVKVAHKTGSITGVHHDCGIVFLPDGRKYVLVLLAKELTNEAAAIEGMATVSGQIYRYLMQK